MAKLKFDRSIHLYIQKDEVTTVPADEVWKVSIFPIGAIKMNGQNLTTSGIDAVSAGYILGGC